MVDNNSLSSVGVVLYPSKLGQKKDGVDETPDQIIDQVKELIEEQYFMTEVYDSPEIRQCNEQFGKSDKETLVFQANLALREDVIQSLKRNKKTLSIGGDHSMGLGTVSGFLDVYPTDSRVVWIDAHADMNTRRSSPSGNIHGMPLSFIFGWDQDDRFPVSHTLNHRHITYIGVRDIDEFEQVMIKNLGINLIPPNDVVRSDRDQIRQWVKDFIGTDKTVHISWDVDSTDPNSEIGATGTRAENGIECDHVKEFIQAISELNEVVSMDVTELNLSLAKNDEEKQRSLEKTLDVIKYFLKCK